MSVYQDLVERKTKLSLIGLGYVGMPIAVEFAKHIEVVGFDVNEEKIRLYRKGVDPTKEVGDEAISSTGVDFTSNPERLREARFHIVAVPTPIDQDKTPDLSPVDVYKRQVPSWRRSTSASKVEASRTRVVSFTCAPCASRRCTGGVFVLQGRRLF